VTLVRGLRLPALALAGMFVVSACLGGEAPSPSPEPTPSAVPTVAPTPSPTPRARSRQSLVVMAPEHPTRLLPGDHLNATEKLLIDVLYDSLYRLDENMQPVPELAKTLPEISKDGLTLTIPIKSDARFHSGVKLRADDVTFSLRMASSPSCPLGRELCATIGTHMASVARDEDVVTITLTEPYAPFLAEGLGRLPILSEDDVKAATSDLIAKADRLNDNRPDKVITDIRDATSKPECFEVEPPEGCRLSDHRDTIEQLFRKARIDLPSELPYIDEAGVFYEDGYLGDLLDRLLALAQVFNSKAEDKQSAALGLLDASVDPFGGGPFELVRIEEDGTFILKANKDHTRGAPKIDDLEVRIQRDPAVATTRLLSGEADWVLEIDAEEAAAIAAVDGFRAASRPLDTQFGILFNVRPESVYFDVATRRAFALCLDREALAKKLDPDRAIATTPYTATSWARPETTVVERDVDAANDELDAAGWAMATDGIRIRDGVRLSTSIAVRPTSVDLFTFANDAAGQLKECGINLVVEELDLTGTTMLDQLQYPNDFDTLLWLRTLGPDPDSAVRVLESSRITTEENVADENPSGFTSSLADHFISTARESYDQAERTEAYAGLQEQLEDQLPYWPMWYDSAASAVSGRLRGPDAPIDPSQSRYDWDISSWTLQAE
jgi:ABC-type transport system substrate-binding protein